MDTLQSHSTSPTLTPAQPACVTGPARTWPALYQDGPDTPQRLRTQTHEPATTPSSEPGQPATKKQRILYGLQPPPHAIATSHRPPGQPELYSRGPRTAGTRCVHRATTTSPEPEARGSHRTCHRASPDSQDSSRTDREDEPRQPGHDGP